MEMAMWNRAEIERVRVTSLAELDELVGRRVMSRMPDIYWEDSYARVRFDSLREAFETMSDPYFRMLIPEADRRSDVLLEVQEFPPYSSEITLAMEVVEHLCAEAEALRLQQHAGRWAAAFGWNPEARAETAPLAICLAALLAKGVEVGMEVREPGSA
jgi:hypothetical protein